MKMHSVNINVQDFYMDTLTWSNEEIGAYFRLLMFESVNGPLDNDPRALSKIMGIEKKVNWKRTFDAIWGEIGHKFVVLEPSEITELSQKSLRNLSEISQKSLKNISKISQTTSQKLINIRLEKEREKYCNWSESQREKANKRWGKDDATALHRHELGNAIPNPNPNPNKDIYIGKKKSVKKTGKKKKAEASPTAYSQDFLQWYDLYPIKTGKVSAFSSWTHLNGNKPPLEDLISNLKRQIEEKVKMIEEGRFTPEWCHPTTYLNQKRWDDVYYTEGFSKTTGATLSESEKILEEARRKWNRG
jgi:uncharacterized protein YdaU (DUF1376 family)